VKVSAKFLICDGFSVRQDADISDSGLLWEGNLLELKGLRTVQVTPTCPDIVLSLAVLLMGRLMALSLDIRCELTPIYDGINASGWYDGKFSEGFKRYFYFISRLSYSLCVRKLTWCDDK